MKIKTTKKEIENAFAKIICIGYCNAQYLLYFSDVDFYTCGVYGWNADIYKINNRIVISTGYSPFGNIRPDYKELRKLDEKAMEIIHGNMDYKQKEKKVNKMLEKFIDKLLSMEE